MRYLCCSRLTLAFLCLCLSACSTTLKSPQAVNLPRDSEARLSHDPAAPALLGTSSDGESDEALANGCVHAWRTALSGKEKESMAELKALDKRYPRAITIKFMMGQVEARCGKKKESVEYFRQAVTKSRFNSMYLFKLAESLRTTGDAQEAIIRYRELIKLNPEFAPGRIGLAKALYDEDQNSREAREQLRAALDLEPDNRDARAFARQLKLVVK